MAKERICIEKREEHIIRTKRIYMEVDSDFFQTYKNLFKYTVNLRSPWSHNYLSWLIVHMNDNNVVNINSDTHREYIRDISKMGEAVPAERTLKQSVAELKKANILLPLSRGRFKINPVIFWKPRP